MLIEQEGSSISLAGAFSPSAALTQAAILDQLAESVIVTDVTGRIILVNAAAARLHGVARLDVEPDGYSDTYHLFTEAGDPHPPSELPLARAVRGEVVSEARFRIRRPDGTEVLAIGDARPLHDFEGRQVGAVLTARDDTAREAAERALRRMNDVLAEKVQERTADLDAARRQAERARLVLRVEDDACHAPVMVDAARLQQVLVNLLGNAVKFTREGGVTARLQCERRDGVLAVKLSVSDTGVGIARHQLGRIFEHFEQGDASTSRRFGGSGLGLAIAQKLITTMGGRICVRSTPGAGSTFTVHLKPPLAAQELRAAAATAAPPSLSGLRVLLAEDVALNRDLVALFLTPLGVDLHMAVDGAAALTAAESVAFDLILMDVQMPVMDGLEATRRIRAGGGPSSATRIVALSANVLPTDLERCRRAGMNDHLSKPFTANTLAQKLSLGSYEGGEVWGGLLTA